VALIEATYWEETPQRREEAAPPSDVRCFLCRQSLEGQPFIAWWTGEVWGPEPQLVLGMHLQHGYHLAVGVLKDLAAGWYLGSSEVNEWLAHYTRQAADRGGAFTPIPSLAEQARVRQYVPHHTSPQVMYPGRHAAWFCGVALERCFPLRVEWRGVSVGFNTPIRIVHRGSVPKHVAR